MAVPGVGDEYVDRTQVALGLVHDRVHRVMVGHVQDAGVRVAGERLKGPCVGGRAHRAHHPVARGQRRARVRGPGRC